MLLVRVRAGREQAAHDLALREGALLVAGLAAIDQRHAVIGLQRRRQALEPALVAGMDMGAGEHEQLPRSGVAADIERPSEGEAGRFDGDDARAGLFGDRHRPVAGAGIDQDDLVRPAALAGEAVQQRRQMSGLVQRPDHDRNGSHRPSRSLRAISKTPPTERPKPANAILPPVHLLSPCAPPDSAAPPGSAGVPPANGPQGPSTPHPPPPGTATRHSHPHHAGRQLDEAALWAVTTVMFRPPMSAFSDRSLDDSLRLSHPGSRLVTLDADVAAALPHDVALIPCRHA